MATNIASSAVVFEVLRNDNYENWSVCLKSYLLAQDLWDIIEATEEPPKPEDGLTNFKDWRKKNAAALHAIQVSCVPDILSQIREISLAKIAWDALAKMQEIQSSEDGELGDQNNEYLHFQPLYEAIKKGDLDVVKNFIDLNPDAVKAKITSPGMTALHVACNAGHLKIVEKLVQFMSEEDLAIPNQFCQTALFNVASAGITKIAECMIIKSKYLACIKDKEGCLPVTEASINGHKDTTRYLYSVTPIDLLFPENGVQGTELLEFSMFGKIYDVSLDLLSRCPRLATARKQKERITMVKLASMPFAFPSGSRLTFWQQWIYWCIHVSLPTASHEAQAQLSTSLPTASSKEQLSTAPPTTSSEVQEQLSTTSNEVYVYIDKNGQSERDNVIRFPVLRHLCGLISNLLKFIGTKEIYDLKWTHLHALQVLRCMCREISYSNLEEIYEDVTGDVVFEATKNGIPEFIIEMTKVDLDLLYLQRNSVSIFMFAIIHRQEKIFSLLYGLDARKYSFFNKADMSNNTMLHLAGMLAPTSQLARISGAALQMQRELQWFKEVESNLNPAVREVTNNDGDTPRQVFTKCHKDLLTEGEKWMKETATSCTVVSALIITIMFATAFTVPGGNDQTGFPIFLHEKSFLVFIISDAISLFSSSTSVLMFLGILTSRYAEDDFLKSLPTKLIIGLFTLFVSIAAMMVAFSAALLIMLKGQLQIAIPIISLASIPVTLYLWLQFPLLIEIFLSTYGPSIFDRKMKPWL